MLRGPKVLHVPRGTRALHRGGDGSLAEPASRSGVFLEQEAIMSVADYQVVANGNAWSVLHDGRMENDYATKEAAFEAAVAAASLAIREGHEIHVSAPGREAGNKTALGATDPR
jgi:hypothetical protein